MGGKPRKGGPPAKRGRGTLKTPVVALVERGGKVKTRVVADVTAHTLRTIIVEYVDQSSTIHTDESSSYSGIGQAFDGGHKTTNHRSGEYAKPDGSHSNTVESYFALIKRGVYGNFHHVSKKHLFRYCAEFEFRWNHRAGDDNLRALTALSQVGGKRLTYQRTAGHA